MECTSAHRLPYIGCFIYLSKNTLSGDLFIVQILEGLTKVFERSGFHGVVLPVEHGQEVLPRNIPPGLSGAVVINPLIDHKLEHALLEARVPFVVVGSPNYEDTEFSVDIDVVSAAYQIAELLISKGHTNISYVNIPDLFVHSNQQRMGFKKAHEEAGIPWREECYQEADFTEDAGRRAASYVMQHNPACSAVVTVNEITAKGVIDYLQEHHVRIPKKMAVASMGGTPIGCYSKPSITTIDFSSVALGSAAAELLQEVIEKKRIRSNHIILPAAVVEREST